MVAIEPNDVYRIILETFELPHVTQKLSLDDFIYYMRQYCNRVILSSFKKPKYEHIKYLVYQPIVLYRRHLNFLV